MLNYFHSLQTIGSIPATGIIDDQTRELLARPRCGVPDTEEYSDDFDADHKPQRRRAKRFVVLGRKWEKTDLTWRYVMQFQLCIVGLEVGSAESPARHRRLLLLLAATDVTLALWWRSSRSLCLVIAHVQSITVHISRTTGEWEMLLFCLLSGRCISWWGRIA